ncbi:uncharacterized protein TRIADDRAFT_28751 [Trichoplax adhaerens]|uniref:RNA N(6)-adenosine-methyltransferase METTL16 n=1 Tax=Trichoplax adhaerens TaxID=10228 RepID=B3S3V1_TRIAD|nr:hypothetical protein TRIADDRAFT_28751 [Trichoplax adhaerens]EDV22529.1 hypothetical protein TRIADDRAFT_28751 [Trichoplax adhaerens]|eukprot:XP_002115073.1 hypothetical protein TRIADDRAFT_28751 [Trichoplax adhaerens]
MHERNRYKISPNFEELARKFPELQPFVKINKKRNKCFINFRDSNALSAVTRALLKIDFNLHVELPMDRLIPTVPLRLNYIHWLEDLIQTTHNDDIFGIDIGTGASCIYPLLAARMNGWNFLATEVDQRCVHYAQKNVTINDLDEKIKIKMVAAQDILCTPLRNENRQQYDFCMCNPPFFIDSLDAKGANRTSVRPQPKSVCTGKGSEIIYDGGEVEFVKCIIEDSTQLQSRVKCYTSMLGKKSSLDHVIAILKDKNVSTVYYTTSIFSQGNTARWSVAWSFCSDLPGNEVQHRT